jgi:hypothetical protein
MIWHLHTTKQFLTKFIFNLKNEASEANIVDTYNQLKN